MLLALTVAFEALEVMRQKAPAGEEAVYRSLISACGRCGNSEKAMEVVEVRVCAPMTRFWFGFRFKARAQSKLGEHEVEILHAIKLASNGVPYR